MITWSQPKHTHNSHTRTTHALRTHYARTTHALRTHYARTTHAPRTLHATCTQHARNMHATCTQHNHQDYPSRGGGLLFSANINCIIQKPAQEEVKVEEAIAEKEPEATPTNTEQIPPIARELIIQRLRQHHQPITLFGETDWQRYMRLKLQEEQEPIEYIEGMDNEFANELRNVEDNHDNKKNTHDDDFTMRPKLTDSMDSIVVIPDGRAAKDKEQFILVLLKTMLSQWEQELNDRPDLEKRTAQGKVATATYNQCRKHIKPVLKLLRERV